MSNQDELQKLRRHRLKQRFGKLRSEDGVVLAWLEDMGDIEEDMINMMLDSDKKEIAEFLKECDEGQDDSKNSKRSSRRRRFNRGDDK